jgi:hypothetical protein
LRTNASRKVLKTLLAEAEAVSAERRLPADIGGEQAALGTELYRDTRTARTHG